jgi:membrane-associated phospholipid phosphatase
MQIEQITETRKRDAHLKSVNRLLAPAWGALLAVSIAGFRATGVRSSTVDAMETTLALLLSTVFPIAIYLRSTKHRYLYLSVSAVGWCLLSTVGSWFCVTLVERLGSGIPLADYQLAQVDAHLGIHVLFIHTWSANHLLGEIINRGYGMQNGFVAAAQLLPIFWGKVDRVQRLNVAFLLTFLLTLPVALMFPAVGPWYLYGFPASEAQQYLSKSILGFRASGGTGFLPIGVIACPSYHVILSFLSAWSLWGIRWLRIPAAIVVLWITASTLTSGMHYFIDIVAGIATVSAAIPLALLITNRWQAGPNPHS